MYLNFSSDAVGGSIMSSLTYARKWVKAVK